jgi:hypothetical protein
MPWGKMDDKFHRNRKVRELRRRKGGMEALGVWTLWWSWCLDDPTTCGEVPALELSRSDERAAALLVEVGLWDKTADGYQFHDFAEYNPTPQQIARKREADRLRIEEKRRVERERQPPKSPPIREDVARDNDATSHATIESVASTRDPVPSQPVPTNSPPIPIPPRPTRYSATWTGALLAIRNTTVHCGTPRFDPSSFREALEWIALQPPDDFAKVLETYAADPWVNANPGHANPNHVRKCWDKYLAGPLKQPPNASGKGPIQAKSAAEYEVAKDGESPWA